MIAWAGGEPDKQTKLLLSGPTNVLQCISVVLRPQYTVDTGKIMVNRMAKQWFNNGLIMVVSC